MREKKQPDKNSSTALSSGRKQKLKSYLFGKIVPAPQLTAEEVTGIINQARTAAEKMRELPSEKIIDVLDRASEAWSKNSYPLRRKALEELPEITGFSREMVEKGLQVLVNLLSAESLKQRLSRELCRGCVRKDDGYTPLDSWFYDPSTGSRLRIVPRGVLLHVSAGNVFLGAADSLIAGLITRNANIVKLSTADPLFPLLLARSIAEHDRDGIISSTFSILPWKGGDDEIETAFKKSVDAIVVWGGEEAVSSWQKDLPATTTLIKHGPKLSIAIVDGHMLERENLAGITDLIATDISLWDQHSCSSPQTIFFEEGPECSARTFALSLAASLEKKAALLPRGSLSDDVKVDLLKTYEQARMGEIFGEMEQFPKKLDSPWRVILKRGEDFEFSPLERTIFVKSVKSLEKAIDGMLPYRDYLQTVGYLLPHHRLLNLSEKLVRVGATRITPVGEMCSGRNGAPHDGGYLLQEFTKVVSLDENPVTRFRALVHHAASRSIFYRKHFRGIDLNGHYTPSDLPLLSKNDIYANSPPDNTNILTGPLTDAHAFASGGSTGKPKFAFYSNEDLEESTDVLAFIYKKAGLSSQDRVGNLFIAGNLWTSFLVSDRAIMKLGALNLPIGGQLDVSEMAKYLEIFQATALVGLPSVILNLAQYVRSRGIKIPIKKVLYGGEHMRSGMRDTIMEAFGCEFIRSAGYALVDTGPVGYQCSYLRGSVHHVLSNYCHVEIIPLENDDSVVNENKPSSRTEMKGSNQRKKDDETGCDRTGEIVVTNLRRWLMPVIRFRTGDLGRWVQGNCPCGSDDRLFELLGRTDDILVIGGMNTGAGDFDRAVKECGELSNNIQLHALTDGAGEALILRVEKLSPDSDEQKIASRLYSLSLRYLPKLAHALKLGWLKTFAIEVKPPGGIPRIARTGKIRQVIDDRQH